MSLEAVTAFRALLARDADLQKTCVEAARAGAWQPIVDAAAARGLVVTAEELKQGVADGELSDQELELVAGGAGKSGVDGDSPVARHHERLRG